MADNPSASHRNWTAKGARRDAAEKTPRSEVGSIRTPTEAIMITNKDIEQAGEGH
jgi:hypothetical protein